MFTHNTNTHFINDEIFQKLRGQQSIAIDDANNQPDFLLQEWLGGGPKRGEGNTSGQGKGCKYLQLNGSENVDLESTRGTQEHRIEIEEGEKENKDINGKSCSHAELTSFKFPSPETYPYCRFSKEAEERRVTIHLKSQGKDLSKLIILPASMEELMRLAGKQLHFL